MGEWDPFKITPKDKESLDVFLKYGMGCMKMYDITYFTNQLSDETACLTLEEFSEKCIVE